MAVEKQMTPSDVDVEDTEAVEVEIVNPEAVSISDDDGAMVIDFSGDMVDQIMGPDHDANLAEYMEDADLEDMASELITDFETDKQSRRDWARSYTRGLDLLGMKIEERTQPWQGAAGNGRTVPCFRSCSHKDRRQKRRRKG